ncbi:hypothetical protein GWI33_015681 [Rhynchophorus ferrugineus]|uniref:Uncharacterized protein n=1 Tax=Rhynchophorus ferrugineus TaxID=354439 RepID=A0A834M5R1_RHYFE|nr:hypothetical protein GWI33_015681 [Rhynchophorus ferrugineus]
MLREAVAKKIKNNTHTHTIQFRYQEIPPKSARSSALVDIGTWYGRWYRDRFFDGSSKTNPKPKKERCDEKREANRNIVCGFGRERARFGFVAMVKVSSAGTTDKI